MPNECTYAGRSTVIVPTSDCRPRPPINAEEAVRAPPTEVQHVAVMAIERVIEVGMGGGDGPPELPVVLAAFQGRQGMRIEADRKPGFSQGDDRVGQLGDIDAAVVADPGRKPGRDPLEQGPAGVGGVLAPADRPSGHRLLVRPAMEVAVGVGDPVAGEAEGVQHRQPVKPVVVRPLPDLEAGRPGANQRSLQPVRYDAAERERIDPRLRGRAW